MSLDRPDFARIGIIGGGQLGQMMILAGTPLGFTFGVLSPDASDPAARLADRHVRGSLSDIDAIGRLCEWADVTTYEIEHISTDGLTMAVDAGHRVEPSPEVLRTINDKLRQKEVLSSAGVPVPAFSRRPRDFPVVQKLRHGGYDGRGVKILRDPDESRLPGDSYYEELVELDLEIAVIVARSVTGETATYPVVEMEFDPVANICSRVSVPARVAEDVAERASRIAVDAAEAIGATGVVAVELFVTATGDILVNEIAPRPHNSGHLTIEALVTSQFEQHLRAICGLPLGSTELRSPAVMVNVLGAADARGVPSHVHLRELAAVPGVHLHWYGKSEVRPFRKMGHVTVVASTVDAALETAARIEPLCRVEGSE